MRLLIVLISLISINLFAQTSFEFLKLDGSARSAALGGAFVSNYDDPSVIFYNPSAVQFVESGKASFGYLKHLLDVNSGFISYVKEFESIGKLGLGVTYTNYGDFALLDEFGFSQGNFSASDFGLIANYSNQLRERISYGLNVKFLYSSIHNVNSVALATDFGFLYYDMEKQFSVGLSALNIGSQIKSYYSKKEKLPLDVRFGLSKKLEHTPFKLHLEFTKLNESNGNFFSRFNNFIFGGELFTSNVLTIRFGYNNERRKELKVGTTTGTEGFNLGLGINIDKFRFDYGLSSLGKIGSLHRVNLVTTL